MDTTTNAELRDRIAEVLRTTPSSIGADNPQLGFPSHHQRGESGYLGWCALCVRDIDALADAVLAVLPPVDRAAVLREAADVLDTLPADASVFDVAEHKYKGGAAADRLRRMADEAQPATEARPPQHAWRVETRDPLANEWAPGSHFLNRQAAVERWETVNSHAPLWKDGTPVERRIVRETTTYTVETP